MKTLKTIGILGLGEYSTEFYLKEIQRISTRLLGDKKIAKIVMHKAEFEKINALLPYQFQKLIPIIKTEIELLSKKGVDIIVIPNMTLHLTVDKIDFPPEVKNKIVHPFDETVNELNRLKISQVTLFGTRHSMKSEEIKQYFTTKNITINEVSDTDFIQIDQLRLETYENGPSEELSQKLLQLGKNYPNPVLICTELSIINVSFVDATKIQIEKSCAIQQF